MSKQRRIIRLNESSLRMLIREMMEKTTTQSVIDKLHDEIENEGYKRSHTNRFYQKNGEWVFSGEQYSRNPVSIVPKENKLGLFIGNENTNLQLDLENADLYFWIPKVMEAIRPYFERREMA